MASLRLGDAAPDFTQKSSLGDIHFHQWLGDSWGVLFSHPADFTPVCTTELGLTAKLKDEFAKRNVKVIALSVDPVDSHGKWIEDINRTQKTVVGFPIIADADRRPLASGAKIAIAFRDPVHAFVAPPLRHLFGIGKCLKYALGRSGDKYFRQH
jgi:alkyl hydroperoxide reductase subunit AhpC